MSNRNALLVFAVLCCFCAPSIRTYSLDSISDPKITSNDKEPVAYVNLQPDSNTVAVFNWDRYDNFNIYRADTPSDSFYLLGKLSAGSAGEITRLITHFYDTRNNAIQNRYIIKPIVNGSERERLPCKYETTDSAYFRIIEKAK